MKQKYPVIKITPMPYVLFDDIKHRLEWRKSFEYSKFPHPTWGQLKLLLGELNFFISCVKKIKNFETNKSDYVVVYIGSCPGMHIPMIDIFFPGLTWAFADPAQISPELQKFVTDNKFIYHKGYADTTWIDSIKIRYPKKKFLFISDIRTAAPGREPSTKNLLDDYKIQWDCLTALNPVAYTIKWRCPFPTDWPTKDKVYIFPGTVYVQAYAKPTSCELRLIHFGEINPSKIQEITKEDSIKIEQTMCYFNQVIRKSQIMNGPADLRFHDHLVAYDTAKNLVTYAWNVPEPETSNARSIDKNYHIYKYIKGEII